MANRSYAGSQLASPDAVKRLMQKTGKGAVKPGGAPLDEGIHITPANPVYRTGGTGGEVKRPGRPAPVLSAKKRKNLKENVGLKNAAARRLSKIGASKFGGRPV